MATKKRRRGGRVNPAPQSELTQLLRQNHQALGALGVVNVVAHLAGLEHEEGPAASAQRGHVFIRKIAEDRSKLAAGALASAAQVWPDEEVRAAAAAALQARRHQLSGVLRELDQTHVAEVRRLTNEYRDSSVLLIELTVGRHQSVTLAAVSNRLRRSSVEFSVHPERAKTAADRFEFAPSPGSPRRILEQMSTEAARLDAWMLTACRTVDGEPNAAAFFRWVCRLLEVDVQYPALPRFNRHEADEEERTSADSELTAFLHGAPGRAWSGEPFADLVDHLDAYEWCDGAMTWSPARVAHFLFSPDLRLIDSNVLAMPALLRGWVTHCAAVMDQRKPLLRAVLEEIDRCEPEFLSDVAA